MGRWRSLRVVRRVGAWIAIGILSLAFLVPAALALGPSGTASGPAHPGVFTTVSAEAVTWNGRGIANASTPGSAFTVTTGSTVMVNFSYFGGLFDTNITAELQVIYFGTAISTNSVATTSSPTGHGSGVMHWSFGDYTDLLEGIYEFTASFVNASSSATIWSQSFFVEEQAPYHIGSGFTLFLIALAASEIYTLARTGRRVRKIRGSAPPSQWQGPAATTPPATASTTPPVEESRPPMPSPPPSGGSP